LIAVVTPEQIELVEATVRVVSMTEFTIDFYRRALTADPSLAEMFTGDPAVQRERFGVELEVIVGCVRDHDAFLARTRALGERHREYGVRPAHFAVMGEALMGALAHALGPRWTIATETAWRHAYALAAEAMMRDGY
jgi:nitric oxide dioxygenase